MAVYPIVRRTERKPSLLRCSGGTERGFFPARTSIREAARKLKKILEKAMSKNYTSLDRAYFAFMLSTVSNTQ